MEREAHIRPGCALPSEAFCRTGGEVVPIAAGKKTTDRSEAHIYPGCALPSEAFCRTGGEVVPIAAGKKAAVRSETHICPGCALPSEALGLLYLYVAGSDYVTFLFCGILLRIYAKEQATNCFFPDESRRRLYAVRQRVFRLKTPKAVFSYTRVGYACLPGRD